MANIHPHDYDLNKKIKITFEGMDYWVMPRYRQHYINDTYEPFSLRIVGNYLDSTKTMLDIGAHYGAYSIYAAHKTGAKVIAIEPVEENFSLLKENIDTNKLGKLITAYNVAASDEDGTAELNIPWASDSAGFYEHPLAETIKKQTVEVRQVDSIVDGKAIDFIKIDTEGHEVKVLEGLSRTLKHNPNTVMLIEANPSTLKAAGQSMESLIKKIEEFDKEIYVIDEHKFTLSRLSGNGDKWDNFISPSDYANFFCVPKKDNRFVFYVCHSTNFGGAEMAMVEQIEALRKNNTLSHVVLPNGGGLRALLEDKAISHSVSSYNFWQIPDRDNEESHNRENIEGAAEVANLAAKLNPDLVINNTIVCPWGLFAARANGLPLVWMIHEYGDLDHHFRFLYNVKNIRKFVIDQSDMVICCSESVKQVMLESRSSPKVHALYNLLNINAIEQMASSKSGKWTFPPSDSAKLIMVGRIKEEKGQMLAIEALSKLKEKGITPSLAIVGPGEKTYIRKLKNEIRRFGVTDQIYISEYIPNPISLIKQSDALLTCSVNEAFGRATAEAMILAKPVIGSNSGGTAEMIESGRTGLLFEPGNAADLADQIAALLKRSDLKKLGENGRKRILKMLEPNKLSKRLMEILGDIEYKKDRSGGMIMYREIVGAILAEVSLKSDLNQLKDQNIERISQLETQNVALHNEIDNLINSKSWRMTQPLRNSSQVVKKFKNNNEDNERKN